MLVRRRQSFRLTLGGTACLAAAFAVRLALVAPVNAEWSRVLHTDPGAAPESYLRHRARWEDAHAGGFAMAFAGFGLLLASVLVETAPRAPRPAPWEVRHLTHATTTHTPLHHREVSSC